MLGLGWTCLTAIGVAVITYISDYYSKDDSGTLHHIKEALQNSHLKGSFLALASDE